MDISFFFQETELDILGTVKNLLRQCSEPSKFLKPLSKLLSIIHNRLSRQALCEAFQVSLCISIHFNTTLVLFKILPDWPYLSLQTLSDMEAELKYITDVVIQVMVHWGQSETDLVLFLPIMFMFDRLSFFPQLNAFDSRHLDEIHFDVRLVAFQKVTKHVKEMSTLDMRYLTAIMHNCFHSLEVAVFVMLLLHSKYLFLCLFASWPASIFECFCCVSETDRWHVSGRQRHHVFVSRNNAALWSRMPRGRIQGDCAVHDTGCNTKGFEEQDWGNQ